MNYDLYNKREYLAELTKRFAECKKGDRILLMAMTIEPDLPEISRLLDALHTAAQAGARIHLGIDARNFLDSGNRANNSLLRSNKFGPLWLHSHLPAKLVYPYDIRYSAISRFAQSENIQAKIINLPGRRYSVTFAGRSHIKAAIINNYAFVGGCNLDDADNIDIMVGWHDKTSVTELYQVLSGGIDNGTIRQGLSGQDKTITIDENTQVLVDAGERGQSVIFDNVLSLIDRSQKWLLFTSQFFPNGVTAQHLKQARAKNLDLKILCTHWQKFGLVGSTIELTSRAIERLRVPGDMFAGQQPPDVPYLHAKLIASDQGVMIGSHNGVKAGTTFGTAEIALASRDEALALRASQKIQDEIKAVDSRQSQS